jgi:aryl-alcohol dehydrogenase-like predicted oxidoreductase
MGDVILQLNQVANTDIEVSVIGLGTVKFGRQHGVKYPHEFKLPTDDEILNLLAQAHDLRINFLDTAPAYGSSEERLGALLHGQRHRWVIASKAGEEFDGKESHYDFSPSAITASVERSLKRLRTDYLDIVLIHSNGDDVRIIEEDHVFSTLAALKKAGKIRAYGMSTKTIAGGLLTVSLSDIAMVSLNPEYTDEREIIARAKELNKAIFIKKALASGHAHDAAAAMRFAVNEPGVTSVIIGTINPAHLRENVAAIE